MIEQTFPFELGWFKYLCAQYGSRVWIRNTGKDFLIVVQKYPDEV